MKLLIAATLFSSMASANEQACSLNFQDDLLVSSQQTQLLRANKPVWQINQQGDLYLQGKLINTDAQTRQQLQQYQAGLHQNAQQTVVLVADALDLASTAITRVFTEFDIDTGAAKAKIDSALDNMRRNTEQVVITQGDNIHIYGSKFSQVDAGFEDELSSAIDSSAQEIAGHVLMKVGQAMASNDGSLDMKMTELGEKMDKFGQELEAELAGKASQLESRGQQICRSMTALDTLEQQIQQKIPAMQAFDLINSVGQASARQDGNTISLKF